MKIRKRNRDAAAADIAKCFKDHVTSDRPSRTFEFRNRNGSSNYAFSLIWTPGTLALAGDLGEMQLTHYHALWKLEEGLKWAAGPDLHYLLGKSDKSEEIDRDGTLQFAREILFEGALASLICWRDELREWRLDRPTRKEYRRNNRHQVALNRWRRDRPRLEFEKRRMYPGDPGWRMSKAPLFPAVPGDYSYYVTSPPEGWHYWEILREELCDYLQPEAIFTTAGRHDILRALESFMDEASTDHIGDLMYSKLGCDFGYCRDYSFRAYHQVMTIQWGARRALEWLEGERVYAWRDPAELAVAA